MLAGAHAGSLRGRGQGKSASSRPGEQPQATGFASLVDLGLRQSNPFWAERSLCASEWHVPAALSSLFCSGSAPITPGSRGRPVDSFCGIACSIFRHSSWVFLAEMACLPELLGSRERDLSRGWFQFVDFQLEESGVSSASEGRLVGCEWHAPAVLSSLFLFWSGAFSQAWLPRASRFDLGRAVLGSWKRGSS